LFNEAAGSRHQRKLDMTKLDKTSLALGLAFLAVSFSLGCSGSSPGTTADGGPTAKTVVINELFPGGASVADPDWIELKNVTGAAIDLAGYQIRDNSLADLFTFPAGTTIAANGYLLVYADDQAAGGVDGGVHVPWKLSAGNGDEVHLLDKGGVEIDVTSFGVDVPTTKSWGRLPDGTGAFLTTTPTPGASNL
jgi:hypothetical protein